MTIAKIQQEGPADEFMSGFGPDTERTAPFLAGAPLASSSCTYGTSPASSAATASPPQTYATDVSRCPVDSRRDSCQTMASVPPADAHTPEMAGHFAGCSRQQ